MRTTLGSCPEGDTVMATVLLELELKRGHPTELTFPGSPERSPGVGPPLPPGRSPQPHGHGAE